MNAGGDKRSRKRVEILKGIHARSLSSSLRCQHLLHHQKALPTSQSPTVCRLAESPAAPAAPWAEKNEHARYRFSMSKRMILILQHTTSWSQIWIWVQQTRFTRKWINESNLVIIRVHELESVSSKICVAGVDIYRKRNITIHVDVKWNMCSTRETKHKDEMHESNKEGDYESRIARTLRAATSRCTIRRLLR